MGRKKKTEVVTIDDNKLDEFKQQYVAMLDNEVNYSLDVDPENKYDMQPLQKLFVHYYVETKSLPLAAEFAGINEETAKMYFAMYSSQQEIRRLNLAMYQRQFATKMLNIEQLGGYLTSLLIDENVALADRLPTKDKLSIVRMLVDLNLLRKEQLTNPETIIDFTVEEENQIRELEVADIKKILASLKKPKDDNSELIEQIKEASTTKFTIEEEVFLKTLSKAELESLLDTIKGGKSS